jgi:hypothetical protein
VAFLLAPFLSVVSPASGATRTAATLVTSVCGVAQSDVVRVVSVDAPCTVATHVGGSFEVVLRSGWRWGTPTSDSKSIIVAQVTKTSKGVADAVLSATSAGVALIHVTGTIYCSPGEVCPDLAMLWTLRVIVTRSASSPFTLRLTSLDFENTYDVRPGDRFILTLGPSAKYEWGEPTATVSGVVRRVAGHKGATAAGLFIATAPGRTRLSATQTPTCRAHCSSKLHRFWVNVIVTS